MVTVNQNAIEKKVSLASLNNNSTEGRVLSVKLKCLRLNKNESSAWCIECLVSSCLLLCSVAPA